MWIFVRKAFLSVVRERGKPDHFRVRARLRGDIEAIFPEAAVHEMIGADYRFHATIAGTDFALALMREADAVNYDNFKASLEPGDRCRWYTNVWYAMKSAQDFEEDQEARRLRGDPRLKTPIFDEDEFLIDDPDEELEVGHASP